MTDFPPVEQGGGYRSLLAMLRPSLFVAGLLAALAAALAAAEPQPVPAGPAQAERLKALREIYASEYGQRRGEARASFARTLLDQGRATLDDPAARFVFLREAIDQATKAGDLDTGRAAIDELAAGFTIARTDELLRFYAGVATNLTTLDQVRSVVDAELSITEGAIVVDDYSLAARAAAQADALARRVKDVGMPQRTKQAVERVKELASQYAALGTLTDVLGQMSPEGHGKYGRFLALAKRDWPAALPHLSQGGDVDLRALAAADLAATTPEALLAAADGWWDWGQKQKSAVKTEVAARALVLYRGAQPTLTGLPRARVDKRIEEAGKLLGAAAIITAWPPGAVLALTFEGVTADTAIDLSPNRFKAVLAGPVAERGAWGTALRFDGVDDVATIANAIALQTTASMSLAMWLRPTALDARRNPWHKSFGAEGTWTLEADGTIAFFCGSAGSDIDPYGSCTMPAAMEVDVWAHIVAVRDATARTITWYKDGAEVFRENTGYATTAPSTANVSIGNGYAGAYAGLIDDIGLWPRALSDKEITALYAATVPGRR